MVLEREKKLTIRISEEELRMLGEIAELQGLNPSDYVRQHIRSEYAAKVKKRAKR